VAGDELATATMDASSISNDDADEDESAGRRSMTTMGRLRWATGEDERWRAVLSRPDSTTRASSTAFDDDDKSAVPSGRRATGDAALPRGGTEGAAGSDRPSRATRMAIKAWPRNPSLRFQSGINYEKLPIHMALSLTAGLKTLALNTSKELNGKR
jgi:hypothetical protein